MPLPGESIQTIVDLLDEALSILEYGPGETEEFKEVNNLVGRAKRMLSDEEMEIIRFGDLTRLADHTYQPYHSIKSALAFLDKSLIPYQLVVTFADESLVALSDAIEVLRECIESQQYHI